MTSTSRPLSPAVATIRAILHDGDWHTDELVRLRAISHLQLAYYPQCLAAGKARLRTSEATATPTDAVLAERGARYLTAKMLGHDIARGAIERSDSGTQIRLLRTTGHSGPGEPILPSPNHGHGTPETASGTQPAPRPRLLPELTVTVQRGGQPVTYRESEILNMANFGHFDLVTFRLFDQCPGNPSDIDVPAAHLLDQFGIHSSQRLMLSRSRNGVYRLRVPSGHGDRFKLIVSNWAHNQNLRAHTVKVRSRNKFARYIDTIPDDLAGGLLEHMREEVYRRTSCYAVLGQIQHRLNLSMEEAVDEAVAAAVEAMTTYDARQHGSKRPLTFLAYFMSQFAKLPSDIQREQADKNDASLETQYMQAMLRLRNTESGTPTAERISEDSGLAIDDVHRIAEQLRNFRSVSAASATERIINDDDDTETDQLDEVCNTDDGFDEVTDIMDAAEIAFKLVDAALAVPNGFSALAATWLQFWQGHTVEETAELMAIDQTDLDNLNSQIHDAVRGLSAATAR